MTQPSPRKVLADLAAANPGTCQCGHTSSVHGFGSGRCFPCEMAAQWADEECRAFQPVAEP